MNCSMSTMVTPRLLARSMLSNTKSTTSGASPSDISSAMINRGGTAKARREREHLLLATRERARALAASIGEHGEHLVRVCHRGLA